MYKHFILAFTLVTLFSITAQAQGPQNKPFGLGLCLGEPAGVTTKYWFDKKHALDAAIGYGFFPHRGVAVYADYLYHLLDIVKANQVPFNLLFYIGVGGKFGYWYHEHRDHEDNGVGFGVRAPFGLTMVFSKAPFDVFLEIAPSIAFGAPHPVWFDFDGCIGGRFYF